MLDTWYLLLDTKIMFLQESDLTDSIYNEILLAVTREDETFTARNIGKAIAQIDSKLCKKYDTDTLWAQEGEDRNELILGIAIDFALYHMHAVLEEVPIIRRERYDYARKDLEDIMNGEILLTGISLLNEIEETQDNEISSGSMSERW